MPDEIKQLIQTGVLMLPPGKTVKQAIDEYAPYDSKILETEK